MSSKTYNIDGIPVPLKLFVERRNNATVSITQRNVIIRLPSYLSADEKQDVIAKHLEWAKKTISEKKLFASYTNSIFDYNKEIKIYDTTFNLQIIEINESKSTLKYDGNFQIQIHLCKHDIQQNNIALVKELLIKFTNKLFKNKIVRETLRLNDLHFKEEIKDIKLKHSTSKWGACYPDKTMIFSTKLLLFPTAIIEYVIIHELAHLKEMNHSKKFWNLVQQAMPDYKKHVIWLKKHQNQIDF